MPKNWQYKLAALAFLLGVVLCAGGIFWTVSRAMNPPANATDNLALGELVYFQSGGSKNYIGSYLGAYVVSTGGCNQMTSNNAVDWNCNRWTVQNGWGVLYKLVTAPVSEDDYVVSDAYALIPTSNNSGDNSFAKAKIWSSAVGEGHKWEKVGDVTGKVGVELVLYNLANSDGVVVFGD